MSDGSSPSAGANRGRGPLVGDGVIEDIYAHFEREDVVAEYASFDFLLPPEETIVSLLRDQIEGRRVLDVGVGAGRTTAHLGPLAASYLGVDISKAMIDACRVRFPAHTGTFLVLDVRDMRVLEDDSFDFVLFSFNGLDLVGDHSSRLEALAELRRVCRPGGLLCFSSENLHYVERCLSYRSTLFGTLATGTGGARHRIRQVRYGLARTRMWRRLNPHRRGLAHLDHAMITEERVRQELSPQFFARPRDRIRVQRYFIRPVAQIRQLAAAGFADARVFDPEGREVTQELNEGVPEAWWLYYVAARTPVRDGVSPAPLLPSG